METALKTEAAALERVDATTAALTEAETALAGAETAFSADATDDRWQAVETAQRTHRRCELVAIGATKDAHAATAARESLEREQRAAERAEAAERASGPAFRAAIAPSLAALVELHRAAVAHIDAIKHAVAEQNAAARIADAPLVTDLAARGHVVAALETSDVPAEIGTMMNRARTDAEALYGVSLLLGAEHIVSSARHLGLTVDATAREDIASLLDGSLETRVRTAHKRITVETERGRAEAVERDRRLALEAPRHARGQASA